MSLKSNLIKARGSLVFLVGLTVAFGTVYSLERVNPVAASRITAVIDVSSESEIPVVKRRILTMMKFSMRLLRGNIL